MREIVSRLSDFSVPRVFDSEAVRDVNDWVDANIDAEQRCLIIDFSNVEFMGDDGYSALVDTQQKMQTLGGCAFIVKPRSMFLNRLLTLSGIDALYSIFDTLEVALTARADFLTSLRLPLWDANKRRLNE